MRRSTARLHFAWRTTSLRVGGRAASRRRRSTDKRGSLVLSCLMSPCELSRAVGRLSSHLHIRQDETVLFVSCPVCRCESDERVQTSYFLSATVLSCRESGSHRRSGRDTDKTVFSCELAFTVECGVCVERAAGRGRRCVDRAPTVRVYLNGGCATETTTAATTATSPQNDVVSSVNQSINRVFLQWSK